LLVISVDESWAEEKEKVEGKAEEVVVGEEGSANSKCMPC
jgi:hypothetical protein